MIKSPSANANDSGSRRFRHRSLSDVGVVVAAALFLLILALPLPSSFAVAAGGGSAPDTLSEIVEEALRRTTTTTTTTDNVLDSEDEGEVAEFPLHDASVAAGALDVGTESLFLEEIEESLRSLSQDPSVVARFRDGIKSIVRLSLVRPLETLKFHFGGPGRSILFYPD